MAASPVAGVPNPAPTAAGLDRRLPRAGDVPDDGRGALRSARWPARVPGQRIWEFLCHHQSHVEWVGCSLHDLIQPSFSFLVGVALPFSLASRLARGQSNGQDDGARPLAVAGPGLPGRLPAVDRPAARPTSPSRTRSARSAWATRSCSCWAFFSVRVQWIALGVILVGYWAAFAVYPLPARTSITRPSAFPRTGRISDRLRRPLGQEQQPGLGVRHLVPEPVSRGPSRSGTTAAATRR